MVNAVNGGYGQNLAVGTNQFPNPSGIGLVITGIPFSTGWYYGEVNNYIYYGQATPGGDFSTYGHFTQVVWVATTKIGCYTATCPNGVTNAQGFGNYLTFCNYNPAGKFDLIGPYLMPC